MSALIRMSDCQNVVPVIIKAEAEACVGNYLTLLLIGLSLIIYLTVACFAASCSRMLNLDNNPSSALFIVDRFI